MHRTLGNFIQRHAEAVSTIYDVSVLYIVSDPQLHQSIELEYSTRGNLHEVIVYYRDDVPLISKRRAFRKGLRFIENNGLGRAQIVHQHVIWSLGWMGKWAASKWKVPLVVTEHWTGYSERRRSERPWLLRPFARWIVKSTDIICPVSKELENTMRTFGLEGTYRVIQNVADTALFVPGKTPHQPTFIHVSHLGDDHKNISGLLRSFAQALQKNSSIKLLLGGDGDIDKWKKFAIELKIPDQNIAFFGEQTPSGIAALMQQSSALVLFSRYENMPVVIAVAMACGLYIISSDVGGISEHVRDDRGITVPSENESALTAAILDFAENHARFDGGKSRNYAISQFSIASIAQQHSQVYDSLMRY